MWRDYICINQADNRERAEQVRIMKSIYEKASAVVGWLGMPQDDALTAAACDMLRRLPSYPSRTTRSSMDHRHWAFSLEGSDTAAVECDATPTRAVVLETNMDFRGSKQAAGTLLHWSPCPYDSADGEVRRLHGFLQPIATLPCPIIHSSRFLRSNPCWACVFLVRKPHTLLDTLASTGFKHCSHDLDMVYAPLPCSPDAHAITLTVTYTKSKTEVYINVVSDSLRRGQGLQFRNRPLPSRRHLHPQHRPKSLPPQPTLQTLLRGIRMLHVSRPSAPSLFRPRPEPRHRALLKMSPAHAAEAPHLIHPCSDGRVTALGAWLGQFPRHHASARRAEWTFAMYIPDAASCTGFRQAEDLDDAKEFTARVPWAFTWWKTESMRQDFVDIQCGIRRRAVRKHYELRRSLYLWERAGCRIWRNVTRGWSRF